MEKKSKIKEFFSTLPSKGNNYFKDYFKHLNYPFYISMILVSIGLFLTDYFSKINAFYYLTDGNIDGPTAKALTDAQTTVIPGILGLRFTANDGAAGGSFSGNMWALCIVSFIASIMLTINHLFRFDRYNKWMTIGITLMLPGAVGNLVDRMGCLTQSGIYKGGVIDFLYFKFWERFPTCNLADYYLTVGVVILLIGFVLEFKKEYKEMKLEEAKEKELEAQKAADGSDYEDDIAKKLAEKEKEEKKDEEDSN